MLERLTIRDLVLVEHAEIEFGPGLNVVTGETGAGKSLLVRAIDLLVGGAADADAVREGARAAAVEGEFRPGVDALGRVRSLLAEWGIECDGDVVIVRREVRAGGRSRAVVNESAVTRGALQQLGEALVDLHGQHEHQSLLRPGAGVDVLDRLGGHAATVERYVDALQGWRTAAQDLEALEVSLASYSDRREWLEQAAAELDDAALDDGEEERLKVDAARLAHADRLRTFVTQALERLTEGESAAVDALAAAARAIEQAAAVDSTLADTLPTLDEARIAAAEAARALSEYAAKLEADPQALESVEARRETIARLTRKYRRSVSSLLEWRTELAIELATGADAEGARARARERAEAAEALGLASGRALTRLRMAAAKTWNARLSRELEPLGFPRARIEFTVTPRPPGMPPGARGLDEVEILFGANPGEPSRPLQKIASGGELSRVMLALKAALEAQDPVDLLLFDEVDSGIGGAVARAVGERLRRLSRHRQLVCVTHLPMIAALASHHLRVTKHVIGGRTTARIETMTGRERVEELARMLAGDRVTDTTRRQARELLGEPLPRAVSG